MTRVGPVGSVSDTAGTGVPLSGGKAAGREADHLPPSSAEVKNAWSYASIPQYSFMAWCLVLGLYFFVLFFFFFE
jgi:hypothetical protein